MSFLHRGHDDLYYSNFSLCGAKVNIVFFYGAHLNWQLYFLCSKYWCYRCALLCLT